MFGKDQPDVVTEQDVGDFIQQLIYEGEQELLDYIEEEDALAYISKGLGCKLKDTD